MLLLFYYYIYIYYFYPFYIILELFEIIIIIIYYYCCCVVLLLKFCAKNLTHHPAKCKHSESVAHMFAVENYERGRGMENKKGYA